MLLLMLAIILMALSHLYRIESKECTLIFEADVLFVKGGNYYCRFSIRSDLELADTGMHTHIYLCLYTLVYVHAQTDLLR